MKRMQTRWETFTVGDVVRWNPTCLPNDHPEMKRKYGKGPFKVISVKPAPNNYSGIEEHPQAIVVANRRKRRMSFSGGWFIKA